MARPGPSRRLPAVAAHSSAIRRRPVRRAGRDRQDVHRTRNRTRRRARAERGAGACGTDPPVEGHGEPAGSSPDGLVTLAAFHRTAPARQSTPGDHRREPSFPESHDPALPHPRPVAPRPPGAAPQRHAGGEPLTRSLPPTPSRRPGRRVGGRRRPVDAGGVRGRRRSRRSRPVRRPASRRRCPAQERQSERSWPTAVPSRCFRNWSHCSFPPIRESPRSCAPYSTALRPRAPPRSRDRCAGIAASCFTPVTPGTRASSSTGQAFGDSPSAPTISCSCGRSCPAGMARASFGSTICQRSRAPSGMSAPWPTGQTPSRRSCDANCRTVGCRSCSSGHAKPSDILRRQLEDRTVAWCTGERSGIGRVSMPRDIVLNWFRPGPLQGAAAAVGRPVVLLATDVAAEGLDLQAAGRIVHYDLPWTDVRLAQRNGRAIRRGATHPSVDVIQIAPGQGFEDRLHQLERLLAKAGLPARHGLGPAGTTRWRWRDLLSTTLAGTPVEGVAGVASELEGVLAGIALEGGAGRTVSTVLWWEGHGWSGEPRIVAARIAEAVGAAAAAPPSTAETDQIIASLSAEIRMLLRGGLGRSPRRQPAQPRRPPSRKAPPSTRRRRCHATRCITTRAAGVRAGVLRRRPHCRRGAPDETLGGLNDRELLARLASLPRATPPARALRPRLTGLIVFRKPEGT